MVLNIGWRASKLRHEGIGLDAATWIHTEVVLLLQRQKSGLCFSCCIELSPYFLYRLTRFCGIASNTLPDLLTEYMD